MRNLSIVAIRSPQVTTPHTGQIERPSVLPSVDEISEPDTQMPDTLHIYSDGNTTLAIDPPRTQLDTASVHQEMLDTSDVLIDVRWWLQLTPQDMEDRQAVNFDIAKVLMRRCAHRIDNYQWRQQKALTLRDLLIESYDTPLYDRGSIFHGQDDQDWMEGDYQYRMDFLGLEPDGPKKSKILSFHLTAWHSSGNFPKYIFESRLYLGAEGSLSMTDQAYIIPVERTCWEKIQRLSIGYSSDRTDSPAIDSLQEMFIEHPSAVCLRNVDGNVALSVSDQFSTRLASY